MQMSPLLSLPDADTGSVSGERLPAPRPSLAEERGCCGKGGEVGSLREEREREKLGAAVNHKLLYHQQRRRVGVGKKFQQISLGGFGGVGGRDGRLVLFLLRSLAKIFVCVFTVLCARRAVVKVASGVGPSLKGGGKMFGSSS